MEKRHVWKAFLVSALVLSFGCAADMVIMEKSHGRPKKEFRSRAKKTIEADDYAKDLGYQRGFNAAQSIGFKPVGGLDKKEGIFKGERDGDILTFVIRKGSGGHIMIIEVESRGNADDILKDFIEAYDKEKKGRGKDGYKRGELIPRDGSGGISKGIRESNPAVRFAGVVYRKDA
ncbi:MAG TPA: hypothetical protein VFF54_05400 [Thermodesulfobacteriota bacterium]|nr:hypothetical protein [Thermodesulfobacteriota bacterium]